MARTINSQQEVVLKLHARNYEKHPISFRRGDHIFAVCPTRMVIMEGDVMFVKQETLTLHSQEGYQMDYEPLHQHAFLTEPDASRFLNQLLKYD